ncbi:MAG: T9SS type A sorting domain-containing protein [Aureispira sp.]|nr:T9SS type A sorting domain-containing protein [Aureispira sp.]
MNTFTKLILTTLLLSLGLFQANATHFAAGDLSYTCLGSNQYEIVLKVYTDCSGINPPSQAIINRSSATCATSGTFVLPTISQNQVGTICPSVPTSCNGGTAPGYLETIYRGVVTLPAGCPDLLLTYNQCCRNNAITNIVSPGSESYYIDAMVNTSLCNSSPEFANMPALFACANTLTSITHGTIETDGDSLVYSLANPLGGTGAPIAWTTGATPFVLTGGLNFNSATGQMTFTANGLQVPVLDIIVEEYRNGTLIGFVRRTMQMQFINCSNAPAELKEIWVEDATGTMQSQGLNSTFTLCPGEDLHFQLNVSDPSGTNDSIKVHQAQSTILANYPNAQITTIYPVQGIVDTAIIDVFIPNANLGGFAIGLSDNGCMLSSISSYGFNIEAGLNCVNISGTVAHDTNNNCVVDGAEHRLSNFIVLAQKGSFSTYTLTDANGNYAFVLDTGNYNVTLIPNNLLWQPCQSTVSSNLPIYGSSATTDFAVEALSDCPYMQVDISTPMLRRCFSSIYNISYCNLGTIDANGSYVEVTLDTNLIVDSTSIPIASQTGNVYTFNIGNVAYGDCGMFNIYTRLSCDTSIALGQIHCTQAHIYPDTICIPNPSWNGVNIDVDATCEGDSVSFEIRNIGTGMSSMHSYWVIEDDIIYHNGTFQLGMGGSKIIKFPANGVTYRLEAEQPTAHPWSSLASATVEGCSQGPFTTGFVNIFSLNDPAPYLSIDCQQNVGSYDPNDKHAYPEGYSTPHYIKQNEDLEYKIRFQNTGTAPALTVVVLDTLSEYLDITSVQPGAASHPYTWRLIGENVIEYRFNNINLPDSNANEAASHGFIKFKIKQEADNPLGTVIYNDAAIYFDYNAPIITNETFHTIGDNFVTVLITGTEDVLIEDVEVKVYPNPFTTQATVEVEGGDYQDLELVVYDITGREVAQYQTTDNKIQIQRNNLSQGVYIYQLKGNRELINTGKFIIK